MLRTLRLLAIACLTLACAGCGSGSGGARTADPAPRLLVTAGTTVLPPAVVAPPPADAQALAGARIAANYRLSTPADAPFQFE
ncbi:MAG: hypothetical protein ACK5BN_07260, partial [Planctomycetota bacterium]